jgi:hypothetical protein
VERQYIAVPHGADITTMSYSSKGAEMRAKFYAHKKGFGHDVLSPWELTERLRMIPKDTRTFTARMMGDPIPNDKRRPHLWAKVKEARRMEKR